MSLTVLYQIQTVDWAGDPYESVSYNPETMSLEPRSSFRIWKETVRGVSAPWTPDILEMAGMLQLVYGRFMSVWREKEMAENRNRLKNLLIGSVSHDVRTPLNAVIGYLEVRDLLLVDSFLQVCDIAQVAGVGEFNGRGATREFKHMLQF